MSVHTTADLIEMIRQTRLLLPDEFSVLAGELQARYREPTALARELVQRGWLTSYQVNELFLGRAEKLLLGSYVLLEKVGEGGMGEVFKARNWKLGQIVAVKLIRRERLSNPGVVRRFEREIRAAAQLEHPNIVHAYDADAVGGTHFFVMEYVEGLSLAQQVSLHGPSPIPLACDYMRQAALALQHAHERGMVHRDIKPHNLLVVSAPLVRTVTVSAGTTATVQDSQIITHQIKILDMGLALLEIDDESGVRTMTQEGQIMGTPDFLAPEQAMDAHNVDIRADLYSLGCTFYFLLTGRAPFGHCGLGEKFIKHRFEEPEPVQNLRPEVPEVVAAIVRKLLAKLPQNRYQTPGALAHDLTAFLDGRPVEVTMPELDASSQATVFPGDTQSQPPDAAGLSTEGYMPALDDFYRKQSGVKGPRRWPLLIAAASVVVVLAVAMALLVRHLSSSREPVEPHVDPSKKPGPSVPVVDEKPKPPPATPVTAAWIVKVQALPAETQVETVFAKLKELNPTFDGQGKQYKIHEGAVREIGFSTDEVSDITPLSALTGLESLTCTGTVRGKLATLKPLQMFALAKLDIRNNLVSDLTPLKDMPLVHLDCGNNKIKTLAPLQKLELTHLSFEQNEITDLTPLRKMPLVYLNCGETRVADLTPLQDAPLRTLLCPLTRVSSLKPLEKVDLKELACQGAPIIDFEPLRNMSVTSLQCTFNPYRGDEELLRSLPTLQSIHQKPAVKFFAEMQAQQVAFESWCKQVAQLTAEKQIDAVAAKLKSLNPDFEGSLRLPKIVKGKVVHLTVPGERVTNLTPLRALADLETLNCHAVKESKDGLADLWPLKGMALKGLQITNLPVADLRPLEGMPLENLNANNTRITDLGPLAQPLLQTLKCASTGVKDLAPLAGLPLKTLECQYTKVADLSPLRDSPLTSLNCTGAPIKDFSPLKETKIQTLSCDFLAGRDAAILREISTLKTINGRMAGDLLK